MEIKQVSFSYGDTSILQNVSAQIEKGCITSLLGPNGSGKTTLFHLMTKNLKPNQGQILLQGRDIRDISYKEFAKKVAIVHQYNTAPGDVIVRSLVAYGRTPHTSFYRQHSAEDKEIIDWALATTDMYERRNDPIACLSGGQRQRVWIAMALAQKTELLLLDEPTTYLDIRYQLEMMELIRRLNRELGITIAMVLHDINQAISYSDRIIGIAEGRILVEGATDKVLSSDVLQRIFQVQLTIAEVNGHRVVLPLAAEVL